MRLVTRFHIVALFLALIAASSCNKGLEPPPAPPSISGRVHFVSRWPKKDSVRLLELVLVQPHVPFADSTLIKGLNTTVIPLTGLNYLSSDTDYSYSGIKPGTYNYLGVAQLFDTNVFRDWRVVGFAHDSKDSAISYSFQPGRAITNADVYVNFDSLPRSPLTK